MSEPGRSARRFVVDTNVFVAAIKSFSKPIQRSSEDTKTLSLLIKLITNEQLELVGHLRLVDEYKRLGEELGSETSDLILGQLIGKVKIVVVEEKALRRCKRYLPKGESADVIHAATCLQADAVLITNDRDFDKISQSGMIEVWSISEAIRRLV